jgi:hypothetical protein
MNIVLKDTDYLLRIRRIYRYGGFRERARLRCEIEDLRLRSFGKVLGEEGERRGDEQYGRRFR